MAGKSSVPQDCARGRTRLRDSIEAHLTIVFAALAFSREAQARNIFVRKGAAGHCPVCQLRRATRARPAAQQRLKP